MDEIDQFTDDIVTKLILEGIASPHTIAADGDYILDIDWERLELEYPDIYEVLHEAQQEEVRDALNMLEERGLLEVVGVDSDGDLVYGTTEDSGEVYSKYAGE